MKRRISIAILVLFSTALQAQHEISVYGKTGYSRLDYRLIALENGETFAADNTAFSVGMGYTFELTPHVPLNFQWCLSTGAELSSFSAAVSMNSFRSVSQEVYSDAERTEDMQFNSVISNYMETQHATYLHIPLMLEVRMPSNDNYNWYVAGGAKLGFAISDKYEATPDRLFTYAYLPETGQTFTNMPEHGFVTRNKPSWQGNTGFGVGVDVSLSLETGLRWAIAKYLRVYVGVYMDYGLRDIAPAKLSGDIFSYQPATPETFAYNSVLTSNNGYVDKMKLISIGAKLKIGIGKSKEVGTE